MRVFLIFIFVFMLSLNAYGSESYRVKKGDSLYIISKRFRVPVEKLIEVNALPDDKLKPGMKLKIPSGSTGDKQISKEKKVISGSKEQETTAKRQERGVEKDRNVGETKDNITGQEVHIVRKGDTLSSIARKYGLTLEELKEINDIGSKKLKIGQKINLKKTGPRTYTVKKGDNIWKIARKFNIDVEEIMELNELDSDELRPGQKLVLEAWVDEKELKRYETAISELKALEDIKAVSDSDITRLGIKDRIVLFAKKMLNIPYRFGGNNLMGIDCSGYVQKVFGFLNIPLPRTAREQFEMGKSVDKDELNIGDLVFFRTYASFPSHVGIYLGNNLFIHASSKSRKVTIDSLDAPYYLKRFIGARRIISEGEKGDDKAIND